MHENSFILYAFEQCASGRFVNLLDNIEISHRILKNVKEESFVNEKPLWNNIVNGKRIELDDDNRIRLDKNCYYF